MKRRSEVIYLVAAMLAGAMCLAAAPHGSTVPAGFVVAQQVDYRARMEREAAGQRAIKADRPEAAIKRYFLAAARGDLVAMRGLSSAKAASYLPKPGSMDFQMMRLMGAAYTHATIISQTSSDVMAMAHFDKAAMTRALMIMTRQKLAKMTDSRKRAEIEKMMAQMIPPLAKRLSRYPVQLKRIGGRWLVSGFKRQ